MVCIVCIEERKKIRPWPIPLHPFQTLHLHLHTLTHRHTNQASSTFLTMCPYRVPFPTFLL